MDLRNKTMALEEDNQILRAALTEIRDYALSKNDSDAAHLIIIARLALRGINDARRAKAEEK
jgi:hypothetical protein